MLYPFMIFGFTLYAFLLEIRDSFAKTAKWFLRKLRQKETEGFSIKAINID